MQATPLCISSLSFSLQMHTKYFPNIRSNPLGHHRSPWNTHKIWQQMLHSATERRSSSARAVEYFPAICPHILIREAQPEDYWEVAETHCSSFFPDHGFPMDLVLRADRLVAMFAGFSIPSGRKRKCLVAIQGRSIETNHFLESQTCENAKFEAELSLNSGRVSGILTIDTIAEFLPRRAPLGQRRTGIAYISNVAVRQRRRRKGVARSLVLEAEAVARGWGCRSIALHCDVNNLAAVALYQSQGFRCVKVPASSQGGTRFSLPFYDETPVYFSVLLMSTFLITC